MKARAADPRFRPIDTPPSITQGMTTRLGLVIPCFRESRRLPTFLPGLLSAMETAALPVVIQIVDDGSGQSEADALDAFLEPLRAAHPAMLRPMLRLPANIGKGGTVYAGWDALAPLCTHLAFVDADGAIPADETARLLAMATTMPSGSAVFASRADGALVERQWLRQCAGLVFRAARPPAHPPARARHPVRAQNHTRRHLPDRAPAPCTARFRLRHRACHGLARRRLRHPRSPGALEGTTRQPPPARPWAYHVRRRRRALVARPHSSPGLVLTQPSWMNLRSSMAGGLPGTFDSGLKATSRVTGETPTGGDDGS